MRLAITQSIVAIVAEEADGAQGQTRDARNRQACRPSCRMRSASASTSSRKGSALDGAALDIIEIPGRARCLDCGGDVCSLKFSGRCGCGSRRLKGSLAKNSTSRAWNWRRSDVRNLRMRQTTPKSRSRILRPGTKNGWNDPHPRRRTIMPMTITMITLTMTIITMIMPHDRDHTHHAIRITIMITTHVPREPAALAVAGRSPWRRRLISSAPSSTRTTGSPNATAPGSKDAKRSPSIS